MPVLGRNAAWRTARSKQADAGEPRSGPRVRASTWPLGAMRHAHEHRARSVVLGEAGLGARLGRLEAGDDLVLGQRPGLGPAFLHGRGRRRLVRRLVAAGDHQGRQENQVSHCAYYEPAALMVTSLLRLPAVAGAGAQRRSGARPRGRRGPAQGFGAGRGGRSAAGVRSADVEPGGGAHGRGGSGAGRVPADGGGARRRP